MIIPRDGVNGTGFITSTCVVELEKTGPHGNVMLLFDLGAQLQEGLHQEAAFPWPFYSHILIKNL